VTRSCDLLAPEIARGRHDSRFPMAPQRMVADTRAALGRDVALVTAGRSNVDGPPVSDLPAEHLCLICNGCPPWPSRCPGLVVRLAEPDCKVRAVMGDGAP
jgi:acetolactate synthase I/II/III large subunit